MLLSSSLEKIKKINPEYLSDEKLYTIPVIRIIQFAFECHTFLAQMIPRTRLCRLNATIRLRLVQYSTMLHLFLVPITVIESDNIDIECVSLVSLTEWVREAASNF